MDRLYAAAEPKTSFKALLEEFGGNIPYDDYSVLEVEYDRIVEEVRKEFKIVNKGDKEVYYFNVHLGCSPKRKS